MLSKHIYTAYNQWEAKRLCEKNLAYGTIMLVTDYQQNLTVELSSTPTSTVYGANQVNVMVFPCVVYWRDTWENNVTKKGTITFVSDDLLHDHQQVKRMQERAVSIVSEKTGITFTKFSTSQTVVVHSIRVVTALQTFVPVLSESLTVRTSKLLFIILRAMKENLSQTLQVLTSRFDGMELF